MSHPVLIPVTAGDQGFLFQLFCASRPELVGLPEPLLRMQFQAQSRGYAVQYPTADHVLVQLEGRPVGRLSVARLPDQILLVDIALLPDVQGKGVGTSLLQALQQESAAAGKPLRLSVIETSPAHRLYERLGFVPTDRQSPYVAMQWRDQIGGARCSSN